jgi:hypothetical protein
MQSVDRRVRTLRLRAPDQPRARRGAILVEDALRTATIAGAAGARVLVIRRLDLGAISSAGSPASVALALERQVQRVAAQAVHGESPGAGMAPAVFFRDEVEPLTALARRVALGRPPSEWFWPLVVSGWSRNLSTGETVLVLLRRVLETPAGVLAAGRLYRTLADIGEADTLLAALRPSDAADLFRASGWSRPARAVEGSEIPVLDERGRECLQRWAARWGDEDPRTCWLACLLLVMHRPARVVESRLPEKAAALVHALTRLSRPARAASLSERGSMRTAGHGAVPSDVEWPVSHIEHRSHGRTNEPGPDTPGMRALGPYGPNAPVVDVSARAAPAPHEGESPGPGFPPEAAAASEIQALAPVWGTPRLSAYAGLFFLIPLLTRLEMGQVLATHPELIERDWAILLLHRIGSRLGVSPGDPVFEALPMAGRSPDDADRHRTAEWIRSVRRWHRVNLRRPLMTLARRTGRVAATPTHIDVLFGLDQVDIVIRKAGLDIDPGWVPWLGRLVQFHYLETEARAE